MPKLPRLSGLEVVKFLQKAGFIKVRQKGSHIILIKNTDTGKKGVVVSDHKEIDKGTLSEIIRQSGMTKDNFLKLI